MAVRARWTFGRSRGDTVPSGFRRRGVFVQVFRPLVGGQAFAGSGGFGRTTYPYDHGPSMRHLVELIPGSAPRTRMQLPGGQVFDSASPHFRDLADQYWTKNVYFDLPYQIAEIIQHAETRWVAKP